MYITSGDDQVFAVNAGTGDADLALRARQHRHLQELRDRRQPRRRLLRQPRLPAHARHDDRRARSGNRPAARSCADLACGSRRAGELRLLGDERADLRRSPSDRRRRRLGVRRPRVRDGLQHAQPHARPGRTRSGRFRRTTPNGARPPGSSAEASSGRRRPSTPRRTRSTSAPVPRRRRTTRRCGPAPTRGPIRSSRST